MTRPRRPRLEPLEARLAPSNTPALIADLNPVGDSNPTSFAALGGLVYFAAASGSAVGEELWKTDGTSAGTALVADIYPGGGGFAPHSSSPRNLTAVGNTLFFSATDGSTGVELWKSDGTAAGTAQVKDIRLGANGSDPARLTAVGNTLYFTATDATTGTELWKSDGTTTVEVTDLTVGSAGTAFGWLKDVGGRLVFARQVSGFGGNPTIDVFAVDPGGLTPIVSYTSLVSEAGVAVVGTRLFYHAFTADQKDTLFVVDTAAATPTPVPLTAVPTSLFGYAQMRYLTAVGDRLYFNAITAVGEEPWVSDGTPGGTHLVKDVSQDASTFPSSIPTEYTDLGGIAYFAATTIAGGRELWRTDGTEAGTRQVADLEPGDTSASPSELVSLGGRLLFDTTAGNAATLRAYDPATDQVTTFPGYALMQPGFFGATFYPHLVSGDVLYMAQKVAADNVGVEPYRLEFDPAPPAITGFDADTGLAGDGLTADNTPRLFGTAAPGAGVRVYDQAALLGSATAAADGRWEFTTAALADGPHAFHARAVNQHGTESADSNALAVTIDTAAPPAPAITGFADDSGVPADLVTNDPTLTLAGTAEPGAAVRVFDDQAFLGEVVAAADGRWAFDTAVLADGPHPFTARAADAAGNVSAAGAALTVVIDTAAPGAPAITGFAADTGLPGDSLTNDPTPTLTGTAEPGSVVAVSDGPTVLGTATAGPADDWQFTAPALADGPHDFTAMATDAAGNPSPSSAPFALAIDTARPTVAIHPQAGQPDPTNGSAVVFAVTFGKPVTGFAAAGVDLSASAAGGTLVAEVAGAGTDYTVTVTGMAGEGDVVVSVRAAAAADAAGNGNPASAAAAVRFDAVAPAVTVGPAPGQADPTDASPVEFAVHFGEPVTGFAADDVSLAGSTGAGTLVAAVAGQGADYTVSVTGMTGNQTVVVSIPAGAAVDAAGNESLAYGGPDNQVTFNDVGTLQFSAPRFDGAEDPLNPVVNVPVTVTRTHGSNGPISVRYTTGDGTAHAPSDYTSVSDVLRWADGDTDPKTILVPVLHDGANEGAEFLTLTLSDPTDGAILGSQTTTRLVIAPSDGKGPGTFVDADGDLVTVRLAPRTGAGSLLVYQTDPDGLGRGPIEWLDLGPATAKATVTVTVRKPRGGTGDGRVALGSVTGGALRALSAPAADLTGPGIQLAGHVGVVRVGNVLPGAEIRLGGLLTEGTTLVAGDVGAGATVAVGGRLTGLTATSIGAAVTAPSAGTIIIKGDLGGTITLSGDGVAAGTSALRRLAVGGSVLPGAVVTAPMVSTIRVRHDLAGDVAISGAGVPANKPALAALSVGGTVRDGLISVGGNVTTVTAAGFDHARLFAGYDGSGHFNGSAVVGTVRVTGRANAFANSLLYAATFKTVALASVNSANGGTPFGVFADETIGRVTVGGKRRLPGDVSLGDFRVEIV